MKPFTCHYIPASHLGDMSKAAGEAIDALFNSDLDVSFGDANRTLIDIPTFMGMLEDGLDQQGVLYKDDDSLHVGFQEIKNVLAPHADEVYIDLEN